MNTHFPFVRYAEKSRIFINAPVSAYDCRMLYILEGRGTFSCGDFKADLKPDMLVYYPAGSCYQIEGDEKNTLLFYTLNFDFDAENADIKNAILPVGARDFRKERLISSHLHGEDDLFSAPFFVENASALKEEIENIYREQESNLLQKDECCGAYLKLVLNGLIRMKSCAHADDTAFRKTLDYIRQNYKEKLDNKKIAAALNYHPNYLNAVVRGKTGLSLHRYITDYRIQKATHLLCSTTLSVAETAELCGFVNANHFSACFKKKTGISPLRYRNANFFDFSNKQKITD